jgi:hypothetical protein
MFAFSRPFVVACCLSAFATAQASEIAVNARYYFPYPDKRHSYHQVYLVKEGSSKPRQLTFDACDKDDLSWVDHDTLAYVAHHRKADEIWLLNVRTRKQHLVARAKGIWAPDFNGGLDAGEPLYIVGQTPRVLRKGRLCSTRRSADPPFAKLPLTVKGRKGVTEFTLSTAPPAKDADSPTLVVTSGGTQHPLPKLSESAGGLRGVLYDRKLGKAWADVVVGESTCGHADVLYALSPEPPFATQVAEGLALDWSPSRGTYAFVTTRSDAAFGPKKSVWKSEAGVAKAGSNEPTVLVKGYVYVTSVSLRP